MQPVASIQNVTKRFGPTLAVDDVSVAFAPGRVHALMGENGAGKSTLMKILAGVHRPDQGEILINGRAVVFSNPRQALDAGVSTVFQELSLLPNLSIAENMFLGKELIGRFGVPDRGEMERLTERALDELDIHIDPGTLVSELSIAERQFVEIAHGIKADANVFILDEPTAALNAVDVDILNRQIRKLTAAGKSVIYISHRMEEIFNICDDVTVMKDGKHVATQPVAELTPGQLIALMVGRELSDLFPPRSASRGEAIIECVDLKLSDQSPPINFKLQRGEILALAGLEGQGQQKIARSLIGEHSPASGKIIVKGHAIDLPMAKNSGIRKLQKLGVGFVPEDRKEEGLLLGMPIHENIAIALHAEKPAYRLIDRLNTLVASTMTALNVKAESTRTAVGALSGGNQQKVLLGRFLASDTDILIIEEPTRGVDIGSKSEIYKILRRLANEGKAILVLSRETIELIGLCDRLLIVHAEKIVQEMAADGATEHAILDAALNA
jgi:ribose transport system ATP-binding protein